MRPFQFLSAFLFTCFASILLTYPAAAQQEEEYPIINEVRAVFDGFKGVSEQFVFSNVQLRPGMVYNPALVDRSIRTLYSTGRFDFVEVKAEPAEEGSIDVVFKLVSKFTIRKIVFTGNEKYRDNRLLKKAEMEEGYALDEFQVSEGADLIEEYYIEKGFPDAEVDYRIERDTETGYARVFYDISENGKVKIRKVLFEGNKNFKDKKLRKVMTTKKSSLISWITGTGKFDEIKFKEDLELIRQFYRNEGYLDVVVDEDLVEFDFRTKKKLWISITVAEGQRYFLGTQSVENATIFTEPELLVNVRIKQGDPFSPEKVDEAVTAVREYYTSRGYLDARVRAERVPDMETRDINLVYRIRESEKFYVESINVEGNTKTKSRVIIRELALRPGDVFDMTRMDTSQVRLDNTSYFEEVRLNPEITNIPGRRDLGITVREGRTGNFTFGAGFGSVENATVFFEISQGNFDLFNWRSGFQGDGQKFRFRASIGTSSNEILISFEEPWLFEQRLAFGVELFRTESDFNSSDYNELRTGFELYLRRRLFELVEARMSYRLELVEIFDVAAFPNVEDPPIPQNPDGSYTGDGVPDVFQAAEGKDLVSKVGITFLRDTRRTLIFTRQGNRTSIASEFAGLGGDVNYFKTEGRVAHFIPTTEALFEQSLSIIARLGTVAPFGSSDTVPFYDRFYLGGPDNLRGFDFRDVGPRDSDPLADNESIGGNTYGFVSFEYLFRVAEPLGLVVFYDWGFVNEDEYDFSASDYADNWGVGARVLLLGSPLQLDFGIPITSPEGSDGGAQFNFSFGTRF
ncbi:MAG: outer membrane protein assembly factor BamA [Verrucomicrobiota bacterium]